MQQAVEADAWKAQKSANIDYIGVDSTLYDQILDMACTLSLIPDRFKGLQGLELYFAMARGHKDAPALDMSKYFNTNYHYLVRDTGRSLAGRSFQASSCISHGYVLDRQVKVKC